MSWTKAFVRILAILTATLGGSVALGVAAHELSALIGDTAGLIIAFVFICVVCAAIGAGFIARDA